MWKPNEMPREIHQAKGLAASTAIGNVERLKEKRIFIRLYRGEHHAQKPIRARRLCVQCLSQPHLCLWVKRRKCIVHAIEPSPSDQQEYTGWLMSRGAKRQEAFFLHSNIPTMRLESPPEWNGGRKKVRLSSV